MDLGRAQSHPVALGRRPGCHSPACPITSRPGRLSPNRPNAGSPVAAATPSWLTCGSPPSRTCGCVRRKGRGLGRVKGRGISKNTCPGNEWMPPHPPSTPVARVSADRASTSRPAGDHRRSELGSRRRGCVRPPDPAVGGWAPPSTQESALRVELERGWRSCCQAVCAPGVAAVLPVIDRTQVSDLPARLIAATARIKECPRPIQTSL